MHCGVGEGRCWLLCLDGKVNQNRRASSATRQTREIDVVTCLIYEVRYRQLRIAQARMARMEWGIIRARRPDCHHLNPIPAGAQDTTHPGSPAPPSRRNTLVPDRVSFQPLASVTSGLEIAHTHRPSAVTGWPTCMRCSRAITPSPSAKPGAGGAVALRRPAYDRTRTKFFLSPVTTSRCPKRRTPR